jgi:lysophospholipase L1-like esterase
MRTLERSTLVVVLVFIAFSAVAQPSQKWVAAWAASAQGPYPVGNPSAQPVMTFAFPATEAGARDQTFRLIVRPDIWGTKARLRFSNAFGTTPVTFDGVFVGLQMASAALVPGTNQRVSFGGNSSVTVAPGQSVWSDAVVLPFVRNPAAKDLMGRKLAVSFHVAGQSGPMTWHAKAMTTSYVTAPGAGSKGNAEDEIAFPLSTASWYFLDEIDVMAPASTRVIVAFGDSITDGTATTINGDDRWPDVLSRRLHALYGNRISVVNEGIGGNQVVGPQEYSPQKPFAGGPSAGQRIDRDILGVSGVTDVIWLEGINDFGADGNASVEAVQAGMKDIVARLRRANPGIRIIVATLTSALGSTITTYGSSEVDAKRIALNDFLRKSGIFDAVVDFDAITLDRKTGGIREEFIPASTAGGPGDKLHPNRAGYAAMGASIDPAVFAIKP